MRNVIFFGGTSNWAEAIEATVQHALAVLRHIYTTQHVPSSNTIGSQRLCGWQYPMPEIS